MTTIRQKKVATNTQQMGVMSSMFSSENVDTSSSDAATQVFVINEQGQEEMITPEMIQSKLTELRAAC